MKTRIGIVEDTTRDQQKLTEHLTRYEKENNEGPFEVKAFSSGQSFLKDFTPFSFDILFLDIQLGDYNGIDLAKEIRKTDNQVIIIFETELEKYAIKGYEVNALDFMLKPIHYSSLSLRLDKTIRLLAMNNNDTLVVPTNCGFTKIKVDDLLYVEVTGHKLFFHTKDSTIQVKGTMSQTVKKLEKYQFLQCNNCYLVNPSKITCIEKYDCILGDIVLQISHPKKKQFVKDFMNYMLTQKGR